MSSEEWSANDRGLSPDQNRQRTMKDKQAIKQQSVNDVGNQQTGRECSENVKREKIVDLQIMRGRTRCPEGMTRLGSENFAIKQRNWQREKLAVEC